MERLVGNQAHEWDLLIFTVKWVVFVYQIFQLLIYLCLVCIWYTPSSELLFYSPQRIHLQCFPGIGRSGCSITPKGRSDLRIWILNWFFFANFCHLSLIVPGTKHPEWKIISGLFPLPTQSAVSSALPCVTTLPSTLFPASQMSVLSLCVGALKIIVLTILLQSI